MTKEVGEVRTKKKKKHPKKTLKSSRKKGIEGERLETRAFREAAKTLTKEERKKKVQRGERGDTGPREIRKGEEALGSFFQDKGGPHISLGQKKGKLNHLRRPWKENQKKKKGLWPLLEGLQNKGGGKGHTGA